MSNTRTLITAPPGGIRVRVCALCACLVATADGGQQAHDRWHRSVQPRNGNGHAKEDGQR